MQEKAEHDVRLRDLRERVEVVFGYTSKHGGASRGSGAGKMLRHAARSNKRVWVSRPKN